MLPQPTYRTRSMPHTSFRNWQSTQHSTTSHVPTIISYLTKGPGPCQSSPMQNCCLKSPSISPYYATVLTLSLVRNIPLSEQRFIILARENCNNRPVKMAKIVATLPSNYICNSFIICWASSLIYIPT